ncbi:hypothetical protein ADA01nite_38340 [Aneurinibacillus danicus]|uniref:Uncharacterized protein n=1 Tax=Aneurinibacillus danicus TaxID=267746 RepID=A0A511VBZ6_9BACL|nr:hypothetical protein ADA01nite_38340 [Aneurinibacillus danicus]
MWFSPEDAGTVRCHDFAETTPTKCAARNGRKNRHVTSPARTSFVYERSTIAFGINLKYNVFYFLDSEIKSAFKPYFFV